MAREHKRREFLAGVGAAGIAGFAGCIGGGSNNSGNGGGGSGGGSGGGGGGSASRSSPIKYGVLLPVTGDLASVGKPMRDAAMLPETQLNNGGNLDIEIDAQFEDGQTNPAAAISAANSLLSSGYPSACGPASSGVNIQVSKQVFIPNGMVGCSPSSTAISVTKLEDNDYVWRTAPSDALQSQALARLATDQANAQTASTLFVNNDYGQGLSNAFVKNFEGEIQSKVAFEKQQPSYTAKLQQALSGNPDTLLLIAYPASGTQIMKDYYADFGGNDRKVLMTDGMQDPTVPKSLSASMSTVIGTAPKPVGPSNEAFTKLYKQEYGRSPGVFNAHSYDASAVLILANAMGGENDGQVVRDNMMKVANPGGTAVGPNNLAEGVKMAAQGKKIKYEGASSPVNFDDNGDMKAVAYSVWKFTNSGVKETDTIRFGG
jgi:ABC-type branched-subunit amino acid transport system substrate-binding protein